MKLPSTGNKTFDYNFNQICKEIDALQKAVNPPQVGSTQGKKLDTGNVRFIKGLDGSGYLEVGGDDGVYTTFQDALQLKGESIPYADLRKLTVKDLFASSFTVRQLNAVNGDYIFSDTAEVSLALGNTITFKDQSNLGICPFRAGDKIITEKYANDKSSNTKYVKATVTSVSGASIVVSYNSATKFSIGDIVVRVGSSTDSSRRDSIYISTNKSHTPYIDVYDGIVDFAGSGSTYWENHIPQVRIGKGSGLNAGYSYGVYIGNGGEFRILPGATVEGVLTHTPVYTMGNAFPGSPVNTDWHFYTKDPPDAPYKLNTWYKYNGVAWEELGLIGTYMDSTGLYTGTVLANKILAGTGIINNLSVLSSLTMGSGSLDGIIQSYGWDGTVNGFRLKGGATPSFDLIGGTLSGTQIFSSSGTRSITLNSASMTFVDTGSATSIIHQSSNGYSISFSAGPLSSSLEMKGDILLNATGDFKFNTEVVATRSWVGTQGYITGYTETDPVFGSWFYKSVVENQSGDWSTAYSWGNHASAGYLTSQNWTASAVSSLGNGLGNNVGQLYIKASNGLGFSGGDLIVNYVSTSLEITGGQLQVKGGYGSNAPSGFYVAESSGGSPTRQIGYVPLTINGTTYDVLIVS